MKRQGQVEKQGSRTQRDNPAKRNLMFLFGIITKENFCLL